MYETSPDGGRFRKQPGGRAALLIVSPQSSPDSASHSSSVSAVQPFASHEVPLLK